MKEAASKNGIKFSARSVGGMFGLYFRESPPNSFDEIMESDRDKFIIFSISLIEELFINGIGCVSSQESSDTEKDIKNYEAANKQI